jgi:hypothetical protein
MRETDHFPDPITIFIRDDENLHLIPNDLRQLIVIGEDFPLHDVVVDISIAGAMIRFGGDHRREVPNTI